MDIHTKYPRKFLDENEDLGDVEAIRKAYARLQKLPIENREQARAFCEAWSEVSSAVDQVEAKGYFAVTRNTQDEEAQKEYGRIISDVIPLAEDLEDKVLRKFLSFPQDWVPEQLAIARKKAQWAVELFREENLPLRSKNLKMRNQYEKVSSECITEYDGEMRTPKQIAPYLEKPDRAVRESAWRAIQGMFMGDYDRLNALFDEMLGVRRTMARNADMKDYVEYQYKNYTRLSYDRNDAKVFRDSIHEHVVPAISRLFEHRRQKLGLETIRPWDVAADPDGAEPPKVYDGVEDLKDKVAAVLKLVDPEFEEGFRLMDSKGYLDLENRPGKAPGAYMNSFAEERISLIFANSAGTARDFDTLLHESGHAMHGFASRHLLKPAREVPLEFCEVASMALELLSRPHLGIIYDEQDRERIGKEQLAKTLFFLPFMAMLDEFQDWVYTHEEGGSAEARADYWRGLEDKYRPHIDWSGLDAEKGRGWQYLHVFCVPLYYIEYGIAQFGALQVFLRSLDDWQTAFDDYKRAIALGSTVGLPELYEAAGVKFPMRHPEVVERVTNGIMGIVA